MTSNNDAPKTDSQAKSKNPSSSRRSFLTSAGATSTAAVMGIASLASLAIPSGAVAIETGTISATISPTNAQTAAFAELPFRGPVTMLNLLKFKPDGGFAKYMKYGQGVVPLVQGVGGRRVFAGRPAFLLIGEQEWDLMVIVEYPSKEAFIGMFNGPEYKAIEHLRLDSLETSVLYAMHQMPITG